VRTNFVQIDPAPLGLSAADVIARAGEAGVGVSPTGGGRVRAVTHLDIDDDDVERAVELLPRSLGVRSGARA
jgi:threonine aldolase